ncbi:hypothetical protein X975_01338, partial [Stegodyphus mimosarum]
MLAAAQCKLKDLPQEAAAASETTVLKNTFGEKKDLINKAIASVLETQEHTNIDYLMLFISKTIKSFPPDKQKKACRGLANFIFDMMNGNE